MMVHVFLAVAAFTYIQPDVLTFSQ